MDVLVGTAEGLHLAGTGRTALAGRDVTALARDDGTLWALCDGRVLLRSTDGLSWDETAALSDVRGHCLLAFDDAVLVGTAGAHLYRLADGRLERVDGFDAAPGRDQWYTPWGGPPDTRSLARDADGNLLANIHVGGVLRSTDGEAWAPTGIDVDADVHQVVADPGRPGVLLAACAVGLGISRDGGTTWDFTRDGLEVTYMRAAAVAEDTVLATSSAGPGGDRAALQRRPIDGGAPFEPCLPETFRANIDTGFLDARGRTAAVVVPSGDVHLSDDAGRHWDRIAEGLPAPRWLLLR